MHISPQQLAQALGGEVSGNQVLAPGPNHSPKDRSLSVRLDDTAPDGMVVHSFAGDDPLACKDYVRDRAGLSKWEPQKPGSANNSIGRMMSRSTRPIAKAGTAPATYVYRLEDGTPYLRVVRPGFYQAHWTGKDWVNGAPRGPKIPYRLPEMLAAEHDDVVVVEGEKDADNVASLGFVSTTNSGGAEKFAAELAEYFKGKNVYVLPDNDEPGERHAKQVVETLQHVALSIRVVRLPGLGDKQDVSDWIAAGGTADDLADLLRRAPATAPVPPQRLIKSSAEFLDGFTPPDYLIDGLVQRRFLYSVTAPNRRGCWPTTL